MSYMKVLAATQSEYSELGLDIGAIGSGAIPTEKEFRGLVIDYVKKNKEMSPVKIKELARSVYDDLRAHVSQGGPGQKLYNELVLTYQGIRSLEVLKKERAGLVKDLTNKGSEEVLKLLKDLLAEGVERVVFPALPKALKTLGKAAAGIAGPGMPYQPYMKVKEHEKVSPEQRRKEFEEGDKAHKKVLQEVQDYQKDKGKEEAEIPKWLTGTPEERYESDRTVVVRNESALKDLIHDLENNIKIHPAKAASVIQLIRSFLTKSVTDIDADIKRYRAEARQLSGKLKNLGKAPVVTEEVIKPAELNVFVDSDNLMKVLKGQPDRVVRKEQPHAYKWLYDSKYITNLFKFMDEKAEPQEDIPSHKYRTDETKVLEDINEVVGHVRNFGTKVIHVVKQLSEGIKEESHMLGSIPKDFYEKYRTYFQNLQTKHNPEVFKKLTEYDEDTDSFKFDKEETKKTPDGKEEVVKHLPDEVHVDRDKLTKVLNVVREIRKKNLSLWETFWVPLNKEIKTLQDSIHDIRLLYNKIRREGFYQKWKRQASDEVYAAVGYLDPTKGLSAIKAKADSLNKFIADHPKMKANMDKAVIEEMMKSEELGEYLDKVQDGLSGIISDIKKYDESMDNFISGILTGRALIKREKKADNGRMETVAHLRKMGLFLMARVLQADDWRSEYPLTSPLVTIRKNPKIYWDYFIKSFPIEEFINKWFDMSGKETLSPEKFPAAVGAFMAKTDKGLRTELEDKLKKEYGGDWMQAGIEEEYNKTLTGRKELEGLLAKARKWAQGMAMDLDKNIESNKVIKEEQKVAIEDAAKDMVNARGELEEALKAPVTKDNQMRAVALQKKLNDVIADLKGVLEDAAETDDTLDHDVARVNEVQHAWADVGVRMLNQIESSEKKELEIHRKWQEIEHWLDKGFSDREMTRIRSFVVRYLWQILDETWMRKVREFQTHYNVGFADYLETHKKVSEIIGAAPPSKALNRIKDAIIEQYKDMKNRKESIPEKLKKDYDAVMSGKYPEELGARPDLPKGKEASYMESFINPPSIDGMMVYRMASSFIGVPVREDLELYM